MLPRALDLIFGMMWAKEMDMMYGTWNVRSLYGASSLITDAGGAANYKLVGVQVVRWDRDGSEPAGD